MPHFKGEPDGKKETGKPRDHLPGHARRGTNPAPLHQPEVHNDGADLGVVQDRAP